MHVHDFEGLNPAELEKLRSFEAQMTDHLAKMATRATDKDLSKAIEAHQKQTATRRNQLDELLKVLGRELDAHEDTAMHAIIAETEKWNDMIVGDTLWDSALVASLQRMEHYEMAVLGTLANCARKPGRGEDEAVLSRNLEQTKKTYAEFSVIAQDALNPAMF